MLRTIDLRGTRPSASELLALVPRAATDVTAALEPGARAHRRRAPARRVGTPRPGRAIRPSPPGCRAGAGGGQSPRRNVGCGWCRRTARWCRGHLRQQQPRATRFLSARGRRRTRNDRRATTGAIVRRQMTAVAGIWALYPPDSRVSADLTVVKGLETGRISLLLAGIRLYTAPSHTETWLSKAVRWRPGRKARPLTRFRRNQPEN